MTTHGTPLDTDESTNGLKTDTSACLNEFDGILAEMKGSFPSEPMTLDEIEDVLNIADNDAIEPLEALEISLDDIELVIPQFEISPDLELHELNNICNGNIDNINIKIKEEYKNEDYYVKKEPNVEVISISSDDSQANETNDEPIVEIESDDCGYNSSDFEFITEEEAKMDGLIINYNPNMSKQVNKTHIVKTIEITSSQKIHETNEKGLKIINGNPKENNPKIDVKNTEFYIEINGPASKGPEISVENCEDFDPQAKSIQRNLRNGPQKNIFDLRLNENINAPGISKTNEPKHTSSGPSNLRNNEAEFERWRAYKLRRNRFRLDYSYRENHRIPNEQEFHNLFHPNLGPLPNRFMENKSIMSSPKMAPFEGIGFDLSMLRQNEPVDHEEREKALVTREKIMKMYPAENERFARILRRRF